MEIRPLTPRDLDLLSEIDGTIESSDYLHVERAGERLGMHWKLHERPLRERLRQSNPIDDEQRLAVRQIVTGADEGFAMLAEHDEVPVAMIVAAIDPGRGVLKLVDLRVDFDFRRQGLGTVMVYSAINEARTRELRAVSAATTTENFPAAQLLAKCGFEIAGLDDRHRTNHDLVKERVTLFWYMPLNRTGDFKRPVM